MADDELMRWLATRPPDPTFEQGQRVRVITMLAGPVIRSLYIGRIGHVTGRGTMPGVFNGKVGYYVQITGLNTLMFTGDMLEAVVPEGAAPGDWDLLPIDPRTL